MNQTSENGKKPSFGPNFGPFGPNRGSNYFFFLIWLCQSLDIMVHYYHIQYQKNTNDAILRKLSDGRMDRKTDQSDFIGCCWTNVKHSKLENS